MKRTLAVLALLAVAAVLFFVLRGDERGPDPVRGADEARSEAPNASDGTLAASDAATERTSVTDPAAAALTEPPPTELAAAPTVDPSQLARIRGVLLHHDGRPATDAKLELRGWTGNSEREQRYGLPAKKWEDVSAAPNADGSFEFVFDAPRAFQFTLDASAPWTIAIDWRWSERLPGSVTDLGVVTLPRGGRIEGRIVTPDGSPAPGRWSVMMRDTFLNPLRSSAEKNSFAQVDPRTMTFVFDGVAPGSVELELNSAVAATRIESVDVVADRTTPVVFVYDGSPTDRLLSVRFVDRCSYVFGGPDMAAVYVRAVESGTVVPGASAQEIDERFVFEGVEPGNHVLVVDDPRFAPFESEPLESGSSKSLRLTGGVELTLVVSRDGVPVEDAAFTFERPEGRDQMMPPHIYVPQVVRIEAPGVYVFGAVPEAQKWNVEAPGCSPQTLDFTSGFEPRSKQLVEVALGAARTITGRVLRASGAPVADAEVHARLFVDEPPSNGDWNAVNEWRERAQTYESHRVYTDTDGRFEFGPLGGASYDLFTTHDMRIRAILLGVAANTKDVELRLEPNGRISGRVQPLFEGCDDMRVHVGLNLGRERVPARLAAFTRNMQPVNVKSDGTFVIEDVPAGPVELHVEMPGVETKTDFGTMRSRGRSLEPRPLTVAPDATTDVVIDLANEIPLAALVRVVDVRGSGATLQVTGARFDDESETWQTAAAGVVDATGMCVVRPIRPGRWRFHVSSSQQTWTVDVPDEHEIAANETLELDFDIELVRGRVTLVDAAGAPLVRGHVRYLREKGYVRLTADDTGVLDLVLPPGTHTLARHKGIEDPPSWSAPPNTAELVWTSDGPRDAVLVLDPRD